MGAVMIGGSYTGKRILDRLPERTFVLLIEGVLVVAGLTFLIGGWPPVRTAAPAAGGTQFAV